MKSICNIQYEAGFLLELKKPAKNRSLNSLLNKLIIS